MTIKGTTLKDCFIMTPRVYLDERGYFYESFSNKTFKKNIGHDVNFIQDNQSFSTYGVLRGLHMQNGKYGQAKLVKVVHGEVLDVAVDLRKESPSFGQHISVVLSSDNHRQIFLPRGIAHGFVVLSNTAIFQYKVDNDYCKESELGVRFDDPTLQIDWRIPFNDIVISDKDLLLPTFKELF